MFDQADRAQLAELGISEADAARQLELFAHPPAPPPLDRPCTVGDGIDRLDAATAQAAEAAYRQAVATGRLLKFVPASGAATRMFHALVAVRNAPGPLTRASLEREAAAGSAEAREALVFIDNLRRFAFADALAALTGEHRDLADVFAALLDPAGLGYAEAPKGLIAFHRYQGGSRTAFEEHLVETGALARATDGTARLHLTVSPEHQAAFRDLLERVRERYERQSGARLDVGFSHQARATDTLAVDLENRPLRDADGRLTLRPGGHGALIDNLDALRADVIYIKNIDNIPAAHLHPPVLETARLLVGHLLCVQAEVFAHLAALADAASVDAQRVAAARRFVARTFGGTEASSAAELTVLLDRPLRVCGMVRNTGEPGGGPFWVRGPDDTCTKQIVESAQVARGEAQQAIFAAATHFNPVVMACAVRDWRGRPFELHAFVDPAAVFITTKSKQGSALKALERPGLWNGSMARWNTVFIEVSDATFTPVKTVNDLLRSPHQPPDAASRVA
jgi:hypothetical protein